MRYTSRPDLYPDAIPFPTPCRLTDANGVDVSAAVVWADTETGEELHLVPATHGRHPYVIDEDRGEFALERGQHPAPLTVTPITEPLEADDATLCR